MILHFQQVRLWISKVDYIICTWKVKMWTSFFKKEEEVPLKVWKYKAFSFFSDIFSDASWLLFLFLQIFVQSKKNYNLTLSAWIYHSFLCCTMPILNENIRTFNLYLDSPNLYITVCSGIYRVGQRWDYSCEYMKQSLFLHYYLFIIVWFSIWTTINLLLPHSVF